MLIAILEHRVEETLRLAGARTRSYQRRARIIAIEPVKGLVLMDVGRVFRVNGVKPFIPMLGDTERQLDGHERLVKEGVLLFQKAPDAPLKDRGGHREGRLHVVGQPFPELCRQHRWDHGQFLRLYFTDQTC